LSAPLRQPWHCPTGGIKQASRRPGSRRQEKKTLEARECRRQLPFLLLASPALLASTSHCRHQRCGSWRAKRVASPSLANETSLPCPRVPIPPQSNSAIRIDTFSGRRYSAAQYYAHSIPHRAKGSYRGSRCPCKDTRRSGNLRVPTGILIQSSANVSPRRLAAIPSQGQRVSSPIMV
jgi:hypothetical protein